MLASGPLVARNRGCQLTGSNIDPGDVRHRRTEFRRLVSRAPGGDVTPVNRCAAFSTHLVRPGVAST